MKKSIICIGMVLHIGVLALADIKPIKSGEFTIEELGAISNLDSKSSAVMEVRNHILNAVRNNFIVNPTRKPRHLQWRG